MADNRVCIMVDTGSDMLPEEADKLGITLLPMTVRFGDEEFYDGVTISRDEFYDRLVDADVIPKTSQITPYRYEEAFLEAVERGEDVVCLTISSGVSGSYSSALAAADTFKGRVHVVDTLQFCGPYYLLAERAVQIRNEGMNASDIAEAITQERSVPRVLSVFDTLNYLKMGGRISSVAAGIGGILAIKPVVTIENGGVGLIGKVRGSKNGILHIKKLVGELGIDWTKPVIFSYSGRDDKRLKQFIEECAEYFEGKPAEELPISRVGSTVGTYSGPDAFAFSFYPLNQK